MQFIVCRNQLLCAFSTLMFAGAPAYAQTAHPAANGADTMDEIIVTAQKRSENLQKVPVSISFASAELLKENNITSTEMLNEVIPSLTFKKGTANVNSTLSIRGIGTQSFSSGAEPSVSTVVDGVVYGRSGMAFQEFTDLDHIEVLGGPQGTLFGKNASAGAVNIVTKAPSHIFGGNASIAYYGGGEVRGDGYITGPLNDFIDFSVSAVYGQYNGNIFNTANQSYTNGYRHEGVRGALVAHPNEDFEFTLRADYTHAGDNCCADVLGPYVGGSSPFVNLLLPSVAASGAHADNKTITNNQDPGTRDGNLGVSAEIDYTMDIGTITSITAWRDWRNKQIRDGDFQATNSNHANSIDIDDRDYGALKYDQYSEELRLASPTGERLQYVVGGFLWFTNERDWFTRYVNQCTASTLPVDSTGSAPCSTTPGVSTLIKANGPANWNTKFYNEALFGQASYDITDALKAIAGIRVTHDHVNYALVRTSYPAGAANAPAGIQPSFAYAESANKNGVSAKGGFEYQIDPDDMVYATYSRGYKGPSLNDFYSEYTTNVGTVPPETSNAYEIGTKNQFFDHDLTFNADLFWEDFSNFQANTFVLSGSTTFVTLGNAGDVRSRGAEFDMRWRVTPDLNLGGGYTYDDAIIVTYNCAGTQSAFTAAPTLANQQSLSKCLAHDGGRLPFAPRNKFNVTANYTVPLPPNLPYTLRVNATYSYSSLINFDLDQSSLAKQNGYGLLDMSITLATEDDKYALSVIGKNLTDQYYTTFITPGGAGPAPGTLTPLRAGSFTRLQVPRDAQRYFGVKLTGKF
jgi:iron complex outermembrane receptor protein